MKRPLTAANSILISMFLFTAPVVTACGPDASGAGDFPHPTEMALADAGFARPDAEAHQVRLANGMVAYVAEDHTVPLVTIGAVISAGSLEGPVAGAAEALAAAWREGGTALMRRTEVSAAFERMVANLTVVQSAEETEMTLNVPREDFGEALTIFAALLRRPSVINADVRSSGQTSASMNADRYSGSLAGAVEAFHGHLYRNHALGRRSGSSGQVTPRRALEYHARFVRPGSVTLAIAGDVSRDDAAAALNRGFSDWGVFEAVERQPAPTLQSDSRREVLLYPADKLQGWVVMGHELPVVPVEDEAALQVMNYILGGGHFDTRLFRATRDRRGLTNDDSGFLEPGVRAPGSYTFRTYGRPEVVPLLIDLTLEEIDRIRASPVTAEELAVAQGALADGTFTLGFRDGASTALTFAREWSRYGEHERSATYQQRIRAVTAEEVQTVAQVYLLPEKIDIVIVGPIPEILNAPPIEDELPIRALGAASRPGAGL